MPHSLLLLGVWVGSRAEDWSCEGGVLPILQVQRLASRSWKQQSTTCTIERCWAYVSVLKDPQARSCPGGGPRFDPLPLTQSLHPPTSDLSPALLSSVLGGGGGQWAGLDLCSTWGTLSQTPLLLFSFGLFEWGCLNWIDLGKQKPQSAECQITHRVAYLKQAKKKKNNNYLLLCKFINIKNSQFRKFKMLDGHYSKITKKCIFLLKKE